MEILNTIIEALQYVLPALVLLLGIKLMQDSRLKQEKHGVQVEIRAEALKAHLPLKFSAYERAVLFLERINPQQLIPRYNGVQATARELMAQMGNDIRQEYEHNIAQQIYITNRGWNALFIAKDHTLKTIAEAYESLPENARALDLQRKIIELYSTMEEFPIQNAIIVLKNDVHDIFRL